MLLQIFQRVLSKVVDASLITKSVALSQLILYFLQIFQNASHLNCMVFLTFVFVLTLFLGNNFREYKIKVLFISLYLFKVYSLKILIIK